ncbi:MAG TPA: excinuclease ABC subunit UvrC [Acidimicrobiia bacterium]|nr:excinuclease ABC subunit UvrC [Acidimicrobiia bacterium]
MVTRPPTGTIPDAPGSYQFVDGHGRVIYVGKAKSLRSRLANYFAAPETLPDRTRQMVTAADHVEWIEVRNEVEALFLEFNLIKRHRPRFNIRLKDDKSYPFLAVTLDEDWPRAMVMRGRKRKGVRYYGPFAHAYAIRETLDLLLRTFPIRTCTPAKFQRHERLGRPCLYAHIEKCAAPCVGAIDPTEYGALVTDLLEFLDGNSDAVIARLERRMHEAAGTLEFELAARLRDQLASVRKAIERQQMVGTREEDYDLLGIEEDPLEASVQVFYVRRGRVVGRKGIVVDKVEDVETPALVARIVEQLYADAPAEDVPKEVLVPVVPEDCELYEEFLTHTRGSRVRIRVPQRGGKRELLATATLNAREAFARHKLRRASDHNARARALLALQESLGLPDAPLRIECFDISNLQGTEIVGSMVVMEDGLPKRSDYRRFKVRTLDGQDDFAAMEEVLTRRFSNYLRERDEGARAGKRFSYPPNLLLIDGGKGQLNVAVRVLEELGLEDIAVASLAKRFEEVHLPGQVEPVRIARDSEALYLLQQVRDEAHRFAITYHRQLRDKKMTKSVLDDVPGLGPGRRARLLREHGSIKKLRALSEADLLAISWLPDAVGRALHDRLHGPGGGVATTPSRDGASTPASGATIDDR